MKWRSTDELRKIFLDFFKNKDHLILPSSSLIPEEDPTLLFTTAGMVQFKPYFEGWRNPPHPRIATVQKCFRLTDLENVGYTNRHHTFFEMLGNFSFGDYFKKEAIEFAWEFSIDVIGFPKDRIWISVYEEDDESYRLWKNFIGIPENRIVKLGKEDNFWGPAGDTGPCGPCTELHFDRGEEYSCGDDCEGPGCDCDRFIEYWNLVFNQFFLNHKGEYEPLPKTGVDTGMGLERLAFLVQGVESVYMIDTLSKIIEEAKGIIGKEYSGENIPAYNVIADHIRAITFVLSEGVAPSNEGRGYVMRKIIRRASLFGYKLGMDTPFLHRLTDTVIDIYKDQYPEIEQDRERVKKLIENEERIFTAHIKDGLNRFYSLIEEHKKDGIIPGKKLFVMYDTFGFPIEVMEDIGKENNIKIDKEGFYRELEKQRERSRKVWMEKKDMKMDSLKERFKNVQATNFTGYWTTESDAEIILLLDEELNEVETLEGRGYVITDTTPAYGESGGQVGDTGVISSDEGRFVFEDTQKLEGIFYHIGEVKEGVLKKGDKVKITVDKERRKKIMCNHTATHLLQAALRKIIGSHIKQSGSYVGPDYLRFDFSHYEPLTDDEIKAVEDEVNKAIFDELEVKVLEVSFKKAMELGAIAFFEEKYGERVRVIMIGDDYSRELCGGTHVDNTKTIGLFTIIKESSPGAGIRRIEAKTSIEAFYYLQSQKNYINRISKSMKVKPEEIENAIERQRKQIAELKKTIEKLKKSGFNMDNILNNYQEINGVKILEFITDEHDVEVLRSIADKFRELHSDGICLLGTIYNDSPVLVFATTKNITSKGIHCGRLIKEAAKILGGGGGGKPEFAQAGGKDKSKIKDAIKFAKDRIVEELKA